MTVLVSGSSGLIGRCVVAHIMKDGHDVVRLVRSQESAGVSAVYWNPAEGEIDGEQLTGIDCVVHLAGENIAASRWTDSQKQKIRDSRLKGTSLLAETLTSLKKPPSTFIMASAMGYYGDRGDTLIHEAAPPGKGFLADLCVDWEKAAQPLVDAGIQTVKLRLGVVLSQKGGALPMMLKAFKSGLGGKIGDGTQYMPWITLKDLVGVVMFTIQNDTIQGPVNTVAPQQVTQAEFAKALGKVLSRPALMSVPKFALKLALGEMAEELLKSVRAVPSVLEKHGYQFTHPDVETALSAILNSDAPRHA